MQNLSLNENTLKLELENATSNLLKLAKESCWNKISENCEFILSEITNVEIQNLHKQRRIRKKLNGQKKPQSLDAVTEKLELIYSKLYDINLYVYHAMKTKTIIEIQYYLKSNLTEKHQYKIISKKPMLHCKLPIPIYQSFQKEKYNVNWELGGLQEKWKTFLWRIKFKLNSEKR